ncbi:hypothetical protein WA026_012178 [Henosepilachna vigintioctopunctata]|uniref:Uncharacterized protein n=1 Tax=Henosepilachna vigintioctopunctata TaxID=420089 RepID=A0AAW1V566_9CUCU
MSNSQHMIDTGSDAKKRKGNRRMSGANFKVDSRRVSFQENVAVRYVSPSSSLDGSSESLILNNHSSAPSSVVDTVQSLSTEEQTTHRKSEIPPIDGRSLDILCADILSDNQENLEEIIANSASTSKALTSISPNLISDDENFLETDSFMKENYPNYYQFLQSHIMHASEDSEQRQHQIEEFKEAIVSCRQYPPEYFDDLENTLKIYSKIKGLDS